jgi:hypothetical protein
LEIEKDAHLAPLQSDPHFASLVSHAKEKAAQVNETK